MPDSSKQTRLSFNIIKQYVEIIQQFKIKKEELHWLIGEESSLQLRFYEGIAKQKFIDDAEAAKALYDNTPLFPAYRALKTEVKKKLMHAILLLDYKHPSMNDVQTAFYTCQKNWSIITILAGRGKSDAAIDLAQTTLELAQKFDLTETVVNTSRILSVTYHVHRPLSRNTENYIKIYADAHELLEMENLAQRYCDDIARHFAKIRIPQDHVREPALQYLERLKPYCEKYDSHRLHLFTRLIEIYSYTCINDYTNAYAVATEAITFFESKPYELKNQLANFQRHKTNCCMLLRRYEEGYESAKRSRELTEIGTHSWYNDSLILIQLCLHTENYAEGWKTYISIYTNPTFGNQNAIVKEEMLIMNAYLQYFISRGKIKTERFEKKYVQVFDYNEFLSSLNLLPNARTGMKVPVLTAQLLWILCKKTGDQMYWLDRCLFTLNGYRTRHTSVGEYSYRTNLFIILCNKLKELGLDRRKIEKAGIITFNRLKAAPQHFPSKSHSIEILPFDIVWREVLGMLK